MIRLVRAEFLKLRTTQVWFWLLLAAVAISALFVIAPLASNGIKDGQDVAEMFNGSGLAYLVLFVLGVLGVTTEFRYQTITPTLLQTPSRWAIVTAKMITYALLGVVYAIICVGLQLAIALPWLAGKNIHFSWSHDHVTRVLIGVFVILVLFGIVGLGIGALLRNQIVAVVVGVIFLAALQNIFVIIPGVKHVYPFLPGGATNELLAVKASDHHINGVHLLPPWGAVVVLLLWAFVPAILGASITMNRDIT
jgi:ABC-type transport system involved in multi-copper enzyme maturation permease subunit